jgi:hypothetical protein
MKRLVDAAVMVVAVIVPSLGSQFSQEIAHAGSMGKSIEIAMKQI